MFNLLISLIVIALIAAMALIATYFIGDRVSESQERAQATAVINAASQIGDATKLYRVNHFGTSPRDVEELINSGYLRTTPDAVWEYGTGTLENPELEEGLCEQVNQTLHNETSIPSCSEIGQSFTGCCAK